MQERLGKPMDLLLGRKTFDGWETYWPTHSNFWSLVMTATKYVASNTRDSSDWQPNVFLSGDIAAKVRELKQQDGPDIYVMGSASFKVTDSQISPNGNIVITYKRDGDVKTGAPEIKEDD